MLVKLGLERDVLDIVPEDLLGREVDVVTEASISPYIREQVLKEAIGL